MLSIQQRIDEAVEHVQREWQVQDNQSEQAPEIIITTGTGLGSITELVDPIAFEMSYDDILHLPPSKVEGHAGRLIIGHCGGSSGKKVIVLDGRVHGYEGHDVLTQVLPFLIANSLCNTAKLAIFTNAAGAINESYEPGQLMIIKDHINFTNQTVVTFGEETNFGGENLDMTYAYTPKYRSMLKEIASKKQLAIQEGVYIALKGAMFETPAEIKTFRIWGADAVGMSTVHEVVAASRLGVEVVGISVLTNMAAGIEDKRLTLQEVLDNTAEASRDLATLILALLNNGTSL